MQKDYLLCNDDPNMTGNFPVLSLKLRLLKNDSFKYGL